MRESSSEDIRLKRLGPRSAFFLIVACIELRHLLETLKPWQLREKLNRGQVRTFAAHWDEWVSRTAGDAPDAAAARSIYRGLLRQAVGRPCSHLRAAMDRVLAHMGRSLATHLAGSADQASEIAVITAMLDRAVNPKRPIAASRIAFDQLWLFLCRAADRHPYSPMAGQSAVGGTAPVTATDLAISEERISDQLKDVVDLLAVERDLPRLVTPAEAARLTGIGAGTLRGAFDRGEILGKRVGSHRKLDVESVKTWCRSVRALDGLHCAGKEETESKRRSREPRRFIPGRKSVGKPRMATRGSRSFGTGRSAPSRLT